MASESRCSASNDHPPGRGGRAVKNGRNEERDGAQPERGRRDARRGLIKSLLRMAHATDENRRAEHEQKVADDRSSDGRFDDAGQPFAQRDQRDDQLRGIAKGRIQKAADARTRARGQLFGRATHPASQRDDRDRGDDERAGSRSATPARIGARSQPARRAAANRAA